MRVSPGALTIGAAGALIVVAAADDLFLTVFNYDGFSFPTHRFHRLLWRGLRTAARPLPREVRHTALSLSSAAMLPASVALWLGLEITGFALMYEAGVASRSFSLTHGPGTDIGSAFYLSAGAISSLSFGDIVPATGLYRALVDLETICGLATFTLALGYVVTTFSLLRTLDSLHGTIRRHAEDPSAPASILARHFRGGSSAATSAPAPHLPGAASRASVPGGVRGGKRGPVAAALSRAPGAGPHQRRARASRAAAATVRVRALPRVAAVLAPGAGAARAHLRRARL